MPLTCCRTHARRSALSSLDLTIFTDASCAAPASVVCLCAQALKLGDRPEEQRKIAERVKAEADFADEVRAARARVAARRASKAV